MVEEVGNIRSNKNMHYGTANVVGVIDNVPDRLPRATLVPRSDTNRIFEQTHHDVYCRVDASKRSLIKREDGFPKVLKIAIPVVAATSLLLFGKSIGKGLKSYFKNFLK